MRSKPPQFISMHLFQQIRRPKHCQLCSPGGAESTEQFPTPEHPKSCPRANPNPRAGPHQLGWILDQLLGCQKSRWNISHRSRWGKAKHSGSTQDSPLEKREESRGFVARSLIFLPLAVDVEHSGPVSTPSGGILSTTQRSPSHLLSVLGVAGL